MAVESEKFRSIEGLDPDGIPFDELLNAQGPVLLRGLVKDWPLVKAGMESSDKAMALLAQHNRGQALRLFSAPAEIDGRFFYNQDLSGFNFTNERMDLLELFEKIRANRENQQHPYFYINSLHVEEGFPGLQAQNNIEFSHPVFSNNQPLSKIWLGTESIASAHYDMPSNLACCVLGKRRFTLFPPEQIHNLYPGPLEPTPAGQVVTMADINKPDFDRFPRLREALDAAIVVDMAPGDALYYPGLWWHQVQAFAPFNIMINYWWIESPAYMGNPMDIVMHGILNLRDRPEHEKKAWREIFEYYVFGSAETPRAHLPESAHGVLAQLDDTNARRLRAQLKNKLNR